MSSDQDPIEVYFSSWKDIKERVQAQKTEDDIVEYDMEDTPPSSIRSSMTGEYVLSMNSSTSIQESNQPQIPQQGHNNPVIEDTYDDDGYCLARPSSDHNNEVITTQTSSIDGKADASIHIECGRFFPLSKKKATICCLYIFIILSVAGGLSAYFILSNKEEGAIDQCRDRKHEMFTVQFINKGSYPIDIKKYDNSWNEEMVRPNLNAEGESSHETYFTQKWLFKRSDSGHRMKAYVNGITSEVFAGCRFGAEAGRLLVVNICDERASENSTPQQTTTSKTMIPETTPTSTTSVETTTSKTTLIPKENALVVIGGMGEREDGSTGLLATTELIYKVNQMKCNISSFPYGLYSHSSTMIPTGILVCGGFGGIVETRCYQYNRKFSSSWQTFPSMTIRRSNFDMKYLNQGIWATGGIGESGSTTSLDYFDFTKNVWTNKTMPFSAKYHCLTKMSENKLILIGGYQNNQVSERTWILDTRSKVWSKGPSMNIARRWHGCFSSMQNGYVSKIVVMGGRNPSYLSSAEMLDVTSKQWRILPNMPFKVASNRGVESVIGPYLGFSVGGTYANAYDNRIIGLRKQSSGNYEWIHVNWLTNARKDLSVVNAPISMLPSC